ncbi:zinc ribbon domain-containing protein [Pseudoclavibacter sp. CFCC 13796]|uniref:zinc ribbon domain-containing protein n=1 Tax=Pseudoclavibacter sp. CFCC 13796 TaxID=2615179 RepID=UPI0039A214A5
MATSPPLLGSSKTARERKRAHDHYLKGSLFCGACGSHLQLEFLTNKQGHHYAYSVCSGRASKRSTCTRRAIPVGLVEHLITDCYRSITITEAQHAGLAA